AERYFSERNGTSTILRLEIIQPDRLPLGYWVLASERRPRAAIVSGAAIPAYLWKLSTQRIAAARCPPASRRSRRSCLQSPGRSGFRRPGSFRVGPGRRQGLGSETPGLEGGHLSMGELPHVRGKSSILGPSRIRSVLEGSSRYL